jgi:hypothetical protein
MEVALETLSNSAHKQNATNTEIIKKPTVTGRIRLF